MALIATLEDLQKHLRLPVGQSSPLSDDEADMTEKLETAQELVLDYIARPADLSWTERIASWVSGLPSTSPATIPPAKIKHAILMQAAELWGFRGDDLDGPKREAPGDLSPTIKALLYSYRDPIAR